MTGPADPQIERRAAPPDPSFACLTYGERLLVWAARSAILGSDRSGSVEHEFRNACGERAGPCAHVAFRQFLVLLGIRGRRPFTLGPPGWCGIAPDERRMLQVIAAAQADDWDRAHLHLDWLLREHAGTGADSVIGMLAAALLEKGHRIPIRGAADAAPGRATWHDV